MNSTSGLYIRTLYSTIVIDLENMDSLSSEFRTVLIHQGPDRKRGLSELVSKPTRAPLPLL